MAVTVNGSAPTPQQKLDLQTTFDLPKLSKDSSGNITGIAAPDGSLIPSSSVPGYSIRNCATGIRICWLVNTTNKETMSRSAHVAKTAMTSLRLVYGNWRTDYLAGDVGTGAPTIYSASIEYPAGVFTQVKFSGSTNGTAADMSNLISDETMVNIPKDALFWVRTHTQNPSGILYIGMQEAVGLGEAMEFGTTAANKTMGGTITPGNAGLVTPYAILSYSNNPSVFILGDSRTAGIHDSYVGNIQPDIGIIARSVGPTHAYINSGIPAESAFTASANMQNRVDLAKQFCTHVICSLGINDLGFQNRTPSQLLSDLGTIYGFLRPLPVWQATLTPASGSTDNWTTVFNQSHFPAEANRVLINNSFRQSVKLSGVFDVADAVETARDSGYWKVPGYTTDGIHETQLACAVIHSSGKINPGVIR